MDNRKDDSYYLGKIISDISFILEHTRLVSLSELTDNPVLTDSVMFRLIQISENSNRLSPQFKGRHSPEIWTAIRGMRNRIVHEYGMVNLLSIYNTITSDLPVFLEELKTISL